MDTEVGRTTGLTETENITQRLEEQSKKRDQSLKQDARERGHEYLQQQKDPASVLGVGDETRPEGLEAEAMKTSDSYMKKASREMRRLSHSLRDYRVDEITQQVQTFAVRHPGLLFGGALIAGFAITRAMKLSARDNNGFKPHEQVYRSGETGFSSSPAEGVVFHE